VKKLVSTMLNRLDGARHEEWIAWASPVPSFGDLANASIATLGINPSNREFVDESGDELDDRARRFHTLDSLGLKRWSQASDDEIVKILDSCSEYFFRNPYGAWFNRLNPIIAATGHSYYDRMFPACHIDLLPFATDQKWGALPASRRKDMLKENADLLRMVIQSSRLELLILNGQSVVNEFVATTGCALETEQVLDWALPRGNGSPVPGVSYRGRCMKINGEPLGRSVTVLGFNHNIQSSFGVTSAVVRNIASWVKNQAEEWA
jgi:hypothetical protein